MKEVLNSNHPADDVSEMRFIILGFGGWGEGVKYVQLGCIDFAEV